MSNPAFPLRPNTQARLAKVIVNIARDRLKQNRGLDIASMAEEAAALVSQLRSLSLLD